MGITQPSQIVAAVEASQTLELNTEKSMLRRKDMKELPEFKAKKKSKVDGNKEIGNGDENHTVNPYDKI